jgi:ABC-type transport system involved in cytochrome c biogenesis permease subunit
MALVLPRPGVAVQPRPTGGFEALILGVAGLLFGIVLVLRLHSGNVTDVYSMFYMFPVALLATYFGMRAGAGAGLLAVALVAVWVLDKHISMSPVGWATRVVPLLLLGALLGEATDRMRRTDAERRKLQAAALLHREAIEINDSIVQGMAAAKWALEAGSVEASLKTLDDTLTRAHALVSDLIRRAEMSERSEQLAGDTAETRGP